MGKEGVSEVGMSGRYIQVDASGLDELAEKMRRAGKCLKSDLVQLLDASGVEMLGIVQDKIIELEAVDTRNLVSSFTKGNTGNVYEFDKGRLSLEIGTNVKYASYVNDGHWLNPKGVDKRFVPGHWNSKGEFVYEPGAKTGMLLKQKYVDGKPYMDRAVHDMESMYPKIVEDRIAGLIEKYLE